MRLLHPSPLPQPCVGTGLGLGTPKAGSRIGHFVMFPLSYKTRATYGGVPERWKGLMGAAQAAGRLNPRPSKAVNSRDIDCTVIYRIWLKSYLSADKPFAKLRRRGMQSFHKPGLDPRGLIGVNRSLARGLVQSDNRLPDCQAGIRVVFLYRQPRVFDRVARPRAIKTIRFPAPDVLPGALFGGWNVRHASVRILYVRAKPASRGKR